MEGAFKRTIYEDDAVAAAPVPRSLRISRSTKAAGRVGIAHVRALLAEQAARRAA